MEVKAVKLGAANGDKAALMASTVALSDGSTKPKPRHIPRYMQIVPFNVLVAVHVVFVLTLRESKTRGGPKYIATTAVAMMELFKLIISLVMVLVLNGPNPMVGLRVMYEGLLKGWKGIILLTVPSFLYVVQNNLMHIAIDNLDAVVYLLCRQMKILFTAIISVMMLSKRLKLQQWVSLLMLMGGVAVVQLSKTNPSKGDDPDNSTIGVIAVFASTAISGFAGVYFERVLKKKGGGAPPDSRGPDGLWVRNIQLSISSVPIAFITSYAKDGGAIKSEGFFYGYTGLVILVVCLQSVQGLMNAVVVNFLDNIIRGFASSYCIVVTLLFEMWFFDFSPSWTFVGGTALVILASIMYGLAAIKKGTAPKQVKATKVPTATQVANDSDALADGLLGGHDAEEDGADVEQPGNKVEDMKKPLL